MKWSLDSAGGERSLEQPIPRVSHTRLPGEDALDQLRRTAQSVAFAFHLDAELTAAQPDFEFSSEAVILPDGVITRSSARGSITLVRDAARVAASGADQLFVIVVEAGALEVRPTRSGRRLRNGDILIIDLAKPVTLIETPIETDYSVTMTLISRSLLPEAVRHLDLHCREIRSDHPLARVIASTTYRLWEDSRRMTPAQGSAVLRATTDMLALALVDTRRARGEEMALKAAAEAIINDHLDDPALSPAWIAERLGVSRATLYRTFVPYGGVARFIDEHRLQRAWVLLSSPVGPPIPEIADLCGYPSKARLTRAIVERLDATPDAIRAASGEAREKLHERAALAIMDAWDRRSGRITLSNTSRPVPNG